MKYIVQSGDSMFSISQKYNLELNTLLAANLQLSKPNEIYPGQEINIPVPGHFSNHGQNLTGPYPEIKVLEPNLNYALLLQEDFAGQVSELTAVLQYTHHYLEIGMLPGLQETAELLEEINIVEMKHIELLGKTIILLGGTPQYHSNLQLWTPLYVSYDDFNPILQLQKDIKGEMDAIVQYNQHIQMIDDPYIKEMLARIVKDEEDHVRVLSIQLNKLA